MATPTHRTNSVSIASFPEVQRADPGLAKLEDTAGQIQQLIAANNVVPSPVSRQLLDVADIAAREKTSPQMQALLAQQICASRPSFSEIQQLIDGNNGVPSSPNDTDSSFAKVRQIFQTARFLAILEHGPFEIRPIPLAESGIPEYLHEIVESVRGNATVQVARNVLIPDTCHSDVDQFLGGAYFVKGCIEDGDVLLHEKTPSGKPQPDQFSYFYDDIGYRDMRGIKEFGWDDSEFYHYSLPHLLLLDKFRAKLTEEEACSDELNALLDNWQPEDETSTTKKAELDVLQEKYEQLGKETTELRKQLVANEPFFDACCRIRDGSLENALKRYYDAGKKVWGVAGANHISPELVNRIRGRRVIVVTLKGSNSATDSDKKQNT